MTGQYTYRYSDTVIGIEDRAEATKQFLYSHKGYTNRLIRTVNVLEKRVL